MIQLTDHTLALLIICWIIFCCCRRRRTVVVASDTTQQVAVATNSESNNQNVVNNIIQLPPGMVMSPQNTAQQYPLQQMQGQPQMYPVQGQQFPTQPQFPQPVMMMNGSGQLYSPAGNHQGFVPQPMAQQPHPEANPPTYTEVKQAEATVQRV